MQFPAIEAISCLISRLRCSPRCFHELNIIYDLEIVQLWLQLLGMGRHARLTPGAVAHALGPCLPPLEVRYW